MKKFIWIIAAFLGFAVSFSADPRIGTVPVLPRSEITGLTAGTLPQRGASTNLVDSPISTTTSTVTVTVDSTTNNVFQVANSGTNVAGIGPDGSFILSLTNCRPETQTWRFST